MKPVVSVIVPARNEAEVIGETLEAISQRLFLPHEVIVVDDHSTDGTADVVRAFRARHPEVRLLSNPCDPGFPQALRFGWENASADLVIPMMADLCDEIETIPEMCEKVREGYDVVCGSRYMRGGGKTGGIPVKNFFSRLVGLSMHLLIGIPTHDVTNAFKMYRKAVLQRLRLGSRGFDVSMEMTLKAFFLGCRIAEVPTFWKGRTVGLSKFRATRMASGYARLYLGAILKRLSGGKDRVR